MHVTGQDGDGKGDAVIDVDPEIVRKGVRSLMHQVAQIERERVCHTSTFPTAIMCLIPQIIIMYFSCSK